MKLLPSIFALVCGIILTSSTPFNETDPNEAGIVFFEGTWSEAQEAAKAEGKPIFLDAYASWCGPCKVLKSRVFTDASVGAYFNENFINVKMDMERGEGRKLAQQYRVQAYPSLYFIEADGSVVKQAVGYHSSEQILALAKSALSARKV